MAKVRETWKVAMTDPGTTDRRVTKSEEIFMAAAARCSKPETKLL